MIKLKLRKQEAPYPNFEFFTKNNADYPIQSFQAFDVLYDQAYNNLLK